MSADSNGAPPKLDPEDIALRAKPRPVRRISRRVLLGVSGTGLVLIFGAVFVALDPPHFFSGDDTGKELYRTDNNPMPDGLDKLPSRYSDLTPPVTLGPPLPGDIGPAVAQAENDLGIAAAPDQPFQPNAEADAARAERIRQARLAQQGRESGVFFQLTSDTKGAVTTPSGQNAATPNAQLPSLSNPFNALAPANALAAAATSAASNDPNGQDRKLAFLNGKPDTDIYSAHSLEDPKSPYQVMAGTIIPASLITGLNSDLPGKVIAQVTENVYDTPTGRFLLIPQGSRVIGTYDSEVTFGQERALVVWQRIIMPDGSSMVIDNLPATDTSGYAGLEDQVDVHTWKILKGITLSTLLGVGTQLTFGSNESDLVKAIRESAQSSTEHAGQSLTEKTLDIQPTITVRPGWPLDIIVNKDIVLRPYRQTEAAQ